MAHPLPGRGGALGDIQARPASSPPPDSESPGDPPGWRPHTGARPGRKLPDRRQSSKLASCLKRGNPDLYYKSAGGPCFSRVPFLNGARRLDREATTCRGEVLEICAPQAYRVPTNLCSPHHRGRGGYAVPSRDYAIFLRSFLSIGAGGWREQALSGSPEQPLPARDAGVGHQ